jgi:hypothetical protein
MLDLTRTKPVSVVVGTPTSGENKMAYTLSLTGIFGATNPAQIRPQMVPCAGSNIAENQNCLADKMEELGADYLLLLETDMAVPPNALTRLVAHGVDIVGACYAFKDIDLLARLYRGEEAPLRLMGHKLGGEQIKVEDLIEAPEGELIPMNFIPMGLTLISAHAIRTVRGWMKERFPPPADMPHKIAPAFYHAIAYTEEHPRGFITTTDSSFCTAAREAGLQIWCDPKLSLAVEHVGDMNYGLVSGVKRA